MGTPVVFDQFRLRQHNGNPIDLDTDTIKVMIVDSTYTPVKASHTFKSDLTGEVSGTNYTARGQAIAGVTLALDTGVLEWAHNDPTWLQSAGGFSNGRTFVWYKDTGTDSTSPLIMYQQEASNFGNVAGDLILDGSAATGVLNVTG